MRFRAGRFAATLPALAAETWAVVRLDGDLHESTADGLRHLYPRLAPGGYVIVDDYTALPACRAGVAEFRRTAGITAPLTEVDGSVSWRKEGR